MAPLLRALWWIPTAYLLGATAYQLTLVIDGRTDNRTVTFVAMLMMLLGAGIALLSVRSLEPAWPVVLLAPSAAAFLIAHFYTYDSYYSPTLRRYSDDGGMEPLWVWLVAAAALVAGVVTWRAPRFGAVATAAVLVVLTGTTALIGTH
jgi:hypothetical protein